MQPPEGAESERKPARRHAKAPKNGLDWFELDRPAAIAVGAALFGVIAGIDTLTPYELGLTPFYLFVVLFVTWNCGWRWGLVFAVVSCAVPFAIGQHGGHPFSSPVYFYVANANRLVSYLVVTGLAAQVKRLLEHEKDAARLDHLTGLPNQKGFYESLDVEIARHRRTGGPMAVAYVDCDNFKAVNDRGGHSEGDRLLRCVAETIRLNVRRTDLTARLGGDEFAVVLSGADQARALSAIGNLRRALDARMAEEGWPVSFSMGLAVFSAVPDSPDEIIAVADGLMYRVKASGKNDILTEVVAARDPGR